jgi:Fe-S cluster assembly scaffold protein SufB
MDNAVVTSIPEIVANDASAEMIHEAAIGRINNEQLLKLQTLGLTTEEAEAVIVEGFLE